MKIVILRYKDCDFNIEYLFSVQKLLRLNYEIDYLNVSAITTHEKGSLHKITGVKYIDVMSYKELDLYIKRQDLKTTFFIPYMIYFSKTWKCFYLLSKYDCTFFYCVTGVRILPNLTKERFVNLFKRLSLKYVMNILANRWCRFMRNTFLIKSASVVLYCGEKVDLYEYKCSSKTKFQPFNSTDAQKYLLESGNREKLLLEKYVVFIDQYIPFHSDLAIIGLQKCVPEQYYRKLNIFFATIEKKYSLRVVIAAHPCAEKYKEHDYFEGRKVYYNSTNALIMHSEAVVLHYSTALSMAVLNNKPCLFISESYFKTILLEDKYISELARLIGAVYYDLDTDYDVEIMSINYSKYEMFKYAYLLNLETEKSDNAIIIDKIIKKYQDNKK